MDRQRLSERRYRAIIGIEAAVLAIGSFAISYSFGDVPGSLFSYGPALWIMAALIVWSAVAWTARKVVVGPIEKRTLTRPIIAWALLRLALLLSCVILLAVGMIALVASGFFAAVFLRAAVLLMVVNFVVGVAVGAIINSMRALQGMRLRAAL